MTLSRRRFIRNAAIGAAVSSALPLDLLAQISEPVRHHVAGASVHAAGGPILLNSNENAYGPPESVKVAMRQAMQLANRYPFHEYDDFISRVARLNRVPEHQVLSGCGSTEILKICADTFLAPGKKLIMASPTFEAIGFYARAKNAPVENVPLTKDYAHDLSAMLARVGSDTGLIYICNPNNPTASLTPRKELDAFIAKLPASTYVLIDEAYHHFATSSPDYVSFLDAPLQDPRIIVARTFSKIYGMAGIRLGYAVALPETIQKMRPWQLQDNVNMLAALGGVAALDDEAAMKAAQARNARDREEFMHQAAARKLTVIPSYCNFAMMQTGRPIQQVIPYFEKNNILIGRRFPAMETYARISFGLPEEMQEFWRVWDKMPAA